MSKDIKKQYTEFFLDSFNHVEDLMKKKSLSELIILEQVGKKMLAEIEVIIKTKDFARYDKQEEDVYYDRACLTDNLSSVMKCIGHHYGNIVFCYNDLKDNFLIFKISKN